MTASEKFLKFLDDRVKKISNDLSNPEAKNFSKEIYNSIQERHRIMVNEIKTIRREYERIQRYNSPT